LRTRNPQDGDEAELIAKSREGDRDSFSVLVERYQRRVVGVALAVVHNQEDALELAQETFVRAFQNLKSFESRSSFSTWLYRIAANLSIDFWRRESRYSVLRGDDAENELRRLPSASPDSFKAASQKELGARLKDALDQLSPEHRQVVILREVDGLSYDEISETLQCPRGTVMSRLHYARNKLREILKDLAN
jgi:RNA polymerase sigma-70 factor (ECF subfamily)